MMKWSTDTIDVSMTVNYFTFALFFKWQHFKVPVSQIYGLYQFYIIVNVL